MADFDSVSPYTLVGQAVAAPGHDLITRTTVGPFIDTGVILNKFDPAFAEANMARVYLAVSTIRELAEGAGLFNDLEERVAAAEQRGYRRGLAHSMKENLHDDIRALANNIAGLGIVVDHLAVPEDDERVEPIVTDAVRDEPAAPTGDEPDTIGTGEGVDGADSAARKLAGQSDGAGRKRRSADVPAGSSNGNPFRI